MHAVLGLKETDNVLTATAMAKEVNNRTSQSHPAINVSTMSKDAMVRASFSAELQ